MSPLSGYMDATTVYRKTKGPVCPNKAFVTAWRAVMLLFDMRVRSPHSIKTCFLEIRCHGSAVALLTRMFQSNWGECMGTGALSRRRWSKAKFRQTTLKCRNKNETGAIMWRCGAVLSDSNRHVLSHLYRMFACGGRCSGYFERSLCIRLTLSLQNELNAVGRPLHKWAITMVVHMSHMHASRQLGPSQMAPCCAIQLDCLLN